jgi:2-keto-3-deoxy-6-phosphogluconate aldolase
LSKAKLAGTLREIGIIATVRVPDEQQLLRGVAALTDGGIRAVELPYATVRGTGWLIQRLKEDGLLVGVGAVTRSAQAREAGVFGADFITASVTTPDVVSACNEIDVACTSIFSCALWHYILLYGQLIFPLMVLSGTR